MLKSHEGDALIEVMWRTYGHPVTPAQTGEITVPVIILDAKTNKPRLDVATCWDNGTWVDARTREELKDKILAWGNLSCNNILFRLGLKDWQKNIPPDLEEV